MRFFGKGIGIGPHLLMRFCVALEYCTYIYPREAYIGIYPYVESSPMRWICVHISIYELYRRKESRNEIIFSQVIMCNSIESSRALKHVL